MIMHCRKLSVDKLKVMETHLERTLVTNEFKEPAIISFDTYNGKKLYKKKLLFF